MYEKWLTNPTRARLDQAIYDALASANKRAQARLVNANEVDAEAVLRHPYGIIIVDGGGVFFQLMARRYEQASTVLTSNKGFEEWGEVFGDEVVAAALIDRLLHHCHIVSVRGNS